MANSRWLNLLAGSCPACGKEPIFKYPLKNVPKFGIMHKSCAHCGVSFEPEPGFYFGAMFVSYALNVALLVGIWLVLYLFWNPSDKIYIMTISLGIILFLPMSFRASRVLWLYAFGGIKSQLPQN